MEEKHFLMHPLITHEVVVKEEDLWCRKSNVREKYMGLRHRKSYVKKKIVY